jgi:hypothetical protein
MVVVIPLTTVVVVFLLIRIIYATQRGLSAAFLYLLVTFLTGYILMTYHVASSTISALKSNGCGMPIDSGPGSDFWAGECAGSQAIERVNNYRHFGSFWLWLLAPPSLRPACEAAGTDVCEWLTNDPDPASWKTYLGRQLLGGLLPSLALGGGLWLRRRYLDKFVANNQPPIVETDHDLD